MQNFLKKMKKFICDIKKTRKHSRCKSHNGYASWLALICFALLLQIISLMSIYVLNSAYLIQANRQSIVDLSCISHAKMMIENNNLVRRCNYADDQLILKKIEEINSEELQGYFNSLTEHYSNSSIQKIFFQVKNAFEYSLNKGFIHENPMLEVLKPKSKKEDKVFHALQVDEQKILTEYIASLTPEEMPYKNCILLELYMGLRVGEALALQFGDINIQKNIISINKTLTTDIDNQVCIGSTTKTYAGQRELPIPDFMRDFIIVQIEIAKDHKNHMLFTTPEGRLVLNSTVNRQLKNIAKQLGIETPVSTHVLRHTYGTRCIESGMRAVALQRLMGHTDITITLNTYTSIFNKYKLEEIEKVNDYFIHNNILNNRSTFQISDGKNQENDLEITR